MILNFRTKKLHTPININVDQANLWREVKTMLISTLCSMGVSWCILATQGVSVICPIAPRGLVTTT